MPSNKVTKLLLLLAVIVVAGAVFFMFSAGRSQPNVVLEARADKDTYAKGEEVTLSLTLRNEGAEAACVSDIGSGSIVFNSLTRDGQEVETRSVPANYIEAFPRLLEASLKQVGPGEDLRITLSSEHDPGLGTRALATTALEGDRGIVTFYNVAEPGRYTIEIAYRYSGPESPECENVFKGPSNTAPVSFMKKYKPIP